MARLTTSGQIRWFSGSGGPLILIPEDLLEAWTGVESSRSGPASDYDRACELGQPVANIGVGSGRAIVLGDDRLATAVWPQASGALFVRWQRAVSEEAILEHVAHGSFDIEGEPVATIEAHPGPLLLFDAACPGYEVEEDRLVVKIHPGVYEASTLRLEPDPNTSLLLMQLKRVHSG